MRITRVEAIPVRVPLKAGMTTKTAHGDHVTSDYVIVRGHTDAGIVGLGEATVAAPWSGETSRSCVAAVHDPGYVRAVQTGEPRSLAESQGFDWDPGVWPMALATNGGVVAAALAALADGVAGSLSSGLHHARRGSGAQTPCRTGVPEKRSGDSRRGGPDRKPAAAGRPTASASTPL